MKRFNICLLLLLIVTSGAMAQEIDTIPINTKGLEIKLKRSPLPARTGTILYKPTPIAPLVLSEKINYWKTVTAIGIDLNQGQYSKNWKGGGVNNIAIGGLLNYKTVYSKESYSFTSEIRLEYGKVKNKDQLQKKTKDRIFWDNKANLQFSKSWFFYGAVTFESQFDRGFAYFKDDENVEQQSLISKFMAPGYFTESIGFEYKPTNYFSTRFGTGTAKQTIILDTTVYNPRFNGGYFGVDRTKNKNFRNELAFQITSQFDKQIFTNVGLYFRYNMFIPYDRPLDHVDHSLDVRLTSKINRFMNASLSGTAIFDKDADKEIQARQNLSIGFGFTFPR
ncbi:MAG: DUF3078 domain-containing protein [Pedobacter sp.]|nr:MAG: DUF3078 domain-containing protein [Pedobacter sp.]